MKFLPIFILCITINICTEIITLSEGKTHSFSVTTPYKNPPLIHEIHKNNVRLSCSRKKSARSHTHTCTLQVHDNFYDPNDHATEAFAVLAHKNQILEPLFHVQVTKKGVTP